MNHFTDACRVEKIRPPTFRELVEITVNHDLECMDIDYYGEIYSQEKPDTHTCKGDVNTGYDYGDTDKTPEMTESERNYLKIIRDSHRPSIQEDNTSYDWEMVNDSAIDPGPAWSTRPEKEEDTYLDWDPNPNSYYKLVGVNPKNAPRFNTDILIPLTKIGLTEENILYIGSLIEPNHSSRIRTEPVCLKGKSGVDKFVNFPEPETVRHDFDTLLAYCRNNPDNLDRVELAAAFAYGFCMVHPFTDGNGRTSRLLANHFLKEGEQFKSKLSDRVDYRKACLKVNETGDLNDMCDYFHSRLIN